MADRSKFAIFLDIDGTLMSNGVIPEKNIEAINSVRKLGHKVFINTGRSYAFIQKELLSAIDFDGIVAGIGSYVKLGDDIIQSITIPEDILKKIVDYFIKRDKWCALEGEEKNLWINSIREDVLTIKNSNELSTVYKGIRISKGTVEGMLSDEDKKFLSEYFTVYQHDNYSEFVTKGCSKSYGMKIMLERLGIHKDNCIAMGDSANDFDMLEFAGISVAMGNSTEEIKELCDFISDTVENAGVASALERICN